jgi:serine/threonine protein kinase/Flp pilus assembly protein TadD
MGEVFLAHDTKLERQVAIKCLAPKAVGNEQAGKRLIREAKAAATLNHPNICTIHEVGDDKDRPFIVMQFVEGETLCWRLRNAPPGVKESVDIAVQVAEALVEAHSRGVVHRDIKPQNLMITPGGLVKVLDFGLAKWTPERVVTDTRNNTLTLLTDPGIVMGTVPYMSPEQIRGDPVDARSDLFALGALLYECVTGKPAFSGSNSVDICAQVIHVNPCPPSELNPEVTPQLDRVVLKALAKDSASRYQSASEMLAELRKVQDAPQQAYQPHSKPLGCEAGTLRTRIKARLTGISSRRTALTVGSVLAVLIVILAIWSILNLWPSSRLQPNREAKRFYEVGITALRDGTYYQASKALERAVELDKKFVLAHARLAEAYAEIDDTDRAKDELLVATALAPNRSVLEQTDASYLDAISATVRRDFAKAVEYYRQITEQASEPEKARAYLYLGRSYEKNDNPDKAIESYTEATKRDQELAAAHLRLGILFGRQQNLDRSKEAFNKAEEFYQAVSNPEGVTEVFYERGALYQNLNLVAEARVQLEKALQNAKAITNKNQQIKTLLQLSSLSWAEGNPEGAKRYATEAIKMAQAGSINNLAINGLIDLGMSYLFREQYSEAEEYLKQALDLAKKQQIRSSEARALLSLGNLYVTHEIPDEAIGNLEQALAYYQPRGYRKETSQALLMLGRAKRQKGDYAKALEIFEQQLQLANDLGDQSDIASSHVYIGYLLGFYQEQYPQALAHFDESTKLYEKIGARFRIGYNYMNRGRLLLLLGRYRETQSALDQALAVANQPGANFNQLLAWVYLATAQMALTQRRFVEARLKARQALDLSEKEYQDAAILSGYTLALAQALSGAPQEAKRLCEAAVAKAKDSGNPRSISDSLLARAEVMLENKEPQVALNDAFEAQASFERSGQQDSEWHAWLIAARASRLLSADSKMHEYATRAANLMSALEQKWGPEAYRSYLSRPDIQMCRRQINQISSTRK